MTDPTPNRPLCIYHANCIDGFTAAWAVWKALGDEFEYYPGIYQQDPPNVSGRGVVMVDFTYPREVVEDMFANGAEYILILDHHLSAAKQWADVLEGWYDSQETFGEYYRYEEDGRTLQVIFDMNESGASMAWRNYHGEEKMPELLTYVRDRDLWRHKLEGYGADSQLRVEYSHAALSSLQQNFDVWDSAFASHNIDKLLEQGAAIHQRFIRDCHVLAKSSRIVNFAGYMAPMINLPYLYASEVGHILCPGYPFAVIYWDNPPNREYSLRSDEGGIDVGEFARKSGGGGHKHSAGFKEPLHKAWSREEWMRDNDVKAGTT